MDLDAAPVFKNLRVLLEGSDRIWIADRIHVEDKDEWYLINNVDGEDEPKPFKVIAWREL